MTEQRELTIDELMVACDNLNRQFQADGVALSVLPTETLLRLQEFIRSQESKSLAMIPSTHLSLPSEDFIIPASIGGSPRLEHVHLCRDTNQDIVNNMRPLGVING